MVKWLVWLGVCGLMWVAFLTVLDMAPKDDTDDPATTNPFERSGMMILTDHGTNCQYLGWRHGGLTPRLYADGSQICDQQAVSHR